MTSVAGMRLAGSWKAILHVLFSRERTGINSLKMITGGQLTSRTAAVWGWQRDAHLSGQGHYAAHCYLYYYLIQ